MSVCASTPYDERYAMLYCVLYILYIRIYLNRDDMYMECVSVWNSPLECYVHFRMYARLSSGEKNPDDYQCKSRIGACVKSALKYYTMTDEDGRGAGKGGMRGIMAKRVDIFTIA